MTQMVEALDALSADPALRALVVTGAGGKRFIDGANVDEMAAVEKEGAREFITLVHRTCDAVRRVPVSTIARIQGHTLGAGLEFAAWGAQCFSYGHAIGHAVSTAVQERARPREIDGSFIRDLLNQDGAGLDTMAGRVGIAA